MTQLRFSDIAHTNNVHIVHHTDLTKVLLTQKCLSFLACLQRKIMSEKYDQGLELNYPSETANIREGDWKVSDYPKELQQRWIEITGPPNNPKWVINALNSGADVYMADLEDSLAPTFENMLRSQYYLLQANLRTIQIKEKKYYKLDEKIATLFVRTRGWHLDEKHVLIDGQYMSASLFDFGVYMFHNLEFSMKQGGIYFYFPKLQGYLEARLWNDVLLAAEAYFDVPVGTIRCTVLIETIEAGLQMEEILYELRQHIVGLNAGRWNLSYQIEAKQQCKQQFIILRLTKFMKEYSDQLIKICHKRGAHAIGGMAAFIPSRTDKTVNDFAFQKITEDKQRDVNDGFDGSWVAHPDLVPIASWLNGKGAVGINNMMEDAATAEISRSQIWQWRKYGSRTNEGVLIDSFLINKIFSEEIEILKKSFYITILFEKAVALTKMLIFGEDFVDFLTIPAYEILINTHVPKL